MRGPGGRGVGATGGGGPSEGVALKRTRGMDPGGRWNSSLPLASSSHWDSKSRGPHGWSTIFVRAPGKTKSCQSCSRPRLPVVDHWW